jgi:hypothetical protein
MEHSVEVLIERLNGRVNAHDKRLADAEKWVEESRVFHQEMRERWATQDGEAKAERKQQDRRHKFNSTLLGLLTVLGIYIAILISLRH